MHQQVNLYQPMFRREPKVFGGMAFVQTAISLVAGLGLIWGYAAWQAASQQTELDRLVAQHAEVKARVGAFAAAHPARGRSQALEEEIARLASERETRQRAITVLERSSPGGDGGFAVWLEGLARQRIQGLWLTAITLGHDGATLDLAGSTLGPELVPQLVTRLAAEERFIGREFHSLELKRPQAADRIDFLLRTAPPKDARP